MKHTIDDLLEIAYQHYPRGCSSEDSPYGKAAEYQRLVAARRNAGANQDTWRELLQRLRARFPGSDIQNRSLHLPAGRMDAGYSGCIFLPFVGGRPHSVGFIISFLVPYHIVYSSIFVENAEATRRARARAADTVTIFVGDTMHVLPRAAVTEELRARADREAREMRPITEQVIGFEPTPEEQPYMEGVTEEIEATFHTERMPPEIGNLIVPEVSANLRPLGEVRIYDCLFSDNW